jgi:Zn-dependent protease
MTIQCRVEELASIKSIGSTVFTIDATVTLVRATRIASESGAVTVTPEHILLALLEPEQSRLRKTLDLFSISPEELGEIAERRTPADAAPFSRMSADAERVIRDAIDSSGYLRRDLCDDIHLFIGILKLPTGTLGEDLRAIGITVEGFRTVVAQFSRDHAYSISRLRDTGLTVNDADEVVERIFDGSAVNLEAIVEERKRIDRISTFPNLAVEATSPKTNGRTMRLPKSSLGRLLAATEPHPIFLSLVAAFLFSSGLLAIQPPNVSFHGLIVVFIASGWMVTLCLHEYGHAAAAYLGGDDWAFYSGYLTLNPLKYANPLFSIVIPLVVLLLGRMPLPGGAVMINTSKLRSRRAELAVHACGPLANALFIAIFSIPFALSLDERLPQWGGLWFGLTGLLYVEVLVLCFNLLPVPPLDGFNILSHWLPYEFKHAARQLGFFPLFFLYFMLSGDNPLGNAFYSTVYLIAGYFHIDPYVGWYALGYLRLS